MSETTILEMENQNLKERKVVTKKDFKKVFWRSFFLQASFNYERMQNLGFLFSVTPILKKFYGDDKEAMILACKRHVEFYNLTVNMTNLVYGVSFAFEEENANGDQDLSPLISSVKTALMGPLAAIGDTLFWGTLRIIATSVGVSLCMKGNALGLLLFVLIYNIPGNILCRWYFLGLGYKMGTNFTNEMAKGGRIQKLTECAYIIGLSVVGAMTAAYVPVSTPLAFKTGESVIKIQEILDTIFPSMLPLMLTVGCAWLMRSKNVKPLRLILILVISGILLGMFGILK